MSFEDDIRHIVNGAANITQEILARITEHREDKIEDKDLAEFDRALERVLNELRNPSSHTGGPSTTEQRITRVEQMASQALSAATKANKDLQTLRHAIEQSLLQDKNDASYASYAKRLKKLLNGTAGTDPASAPLSPTPYAAGSVQPHHPKQ
jgi:hypothetical protein